jgi:predicted peroxiredoxin
MKLGIFVNTDRHLADVVGIAKAAVAKGHEVGIFAMDGGSHLLPNPEFTALCTVKGVSMSYCDHSAKGTGIATDGVPKDIVCGSQYNNAIMVNEADRLIVL